MIVKGYYDGNKSHVSGKGNVYADIFFRGMTADGTADIEQAKLRTFSETVINACRNLNQGDIVELDLTIRDATVEEVYSDVC